MIRLFDKEDKEVKRLLLVFNQRASIAHERAKQLEKLMTAIPAGNCPLYPCYVDRETHLQTRKYANGSAKKGGG